MRFWPRINLVDGTYNRGAGAPKRGREAVQDESEAEDLPIGRAREKAPSPASSPRRKKILPTPSPSIERSPSPSPSIASSSRSRSASPERVASRSASPQLAPLGVFADEYADKADNADDAAETTSPGNTNSIWSSSAQHARRLSRAESALPPLQSTVSQLESELATAREKLKKQERIVGRRKLKMSRIMRKALRADAGAGKVGKGKKDKKDKKDKKGKKRRKERRRASPEL